MIVNRIADADAEASVLSKASTLIDALPWLERFHGQTVVVKYGGNAMTSHELQQAFDELRAVTFIQR